jgi:hypothetical protein
MKSKEAWNMDLDTFITTLYVIVDSWYSERVEHHLKRHAGPARHMSDSEVLTVALAGQWRVGVPWQSERGLVRYVQKHGRHWFPGMLQRSAFNQRVRLLWSALVQLQQDLATWLKQPTDIYECVDCTPSPACRLGHANRWPQHWLWWSDYGRGGTHGGIFFGEQLLVSVTNSGTVTGWLLGPARADDRWLLEAFLSQRAGVAELVGPPTAPSLTPPGALDGATSGTVRAVVGSGSLHPSPLLSRQGL